MMKNQGRNPTELQRAGTGTPVGDANGNSVVNGFPGLCPWQTFLINPYFPLNSVFKALRKSVSQNPGVTACGREHVFEAVKSG